jgi:hypothetical protein
VRHLDKRKILLTTLLRSFILMSYRGRMPPLSYLTMLDVILLVNLGLLSICVLIIVGSAVSFHCF